MRFWAISFLSLTLTCWLAALFLHMLTLATPSVRTFTIPAHSGGGMPPWLSSDFFVDVLATVPGPDGESYTRTIHTQAFVLDCRPSRVGDASEPFGRLDVTLLVTPRQAKALELAQSQGT